MYSSQAANTPPERPASSVDDSNDRPSTSKMQKGLDLPPDSAIVNDASNSSGAAKPSPIKNALTAEDWHLQEITSGLDAGLYKLVLIRNKTFKQQCRASTCLPNELHTQDDDKIHSLVYLSLDTHHRENSAGTEQRKLPKESYHVSCLQAIGVDLAKYLSLEYRTPAKTFQTALVDWVTNKGKTFDLDLYSTTGYMDALHAHRNEC